MQTNVTDYALEIGALQATGWAREDAEVCTLLTNDGRPGMARALRAGSSEYAASTCALADVLTMQARRQETARRQVRPAPAHHGASSSATTRSPAATTSREAASARRRQDEPRRASRAARSTNPPPFRQTCHTQPTLPTHPAVS